MSQGCLIGVDIGTLGCRCSILDPTGKVRGYAYDEYSIESPQPNYAEQNPETYWNATVNTIRKAIQNSNIKGKDVLAIGLTGIQVSFILIDSEGRPLTPSIIYADKRAIEQYEWMKREIGEREIYEITGSRLDPMYPSTKLRWIKVKKPEKLEKTYKVLSPKDYVGFKLTGQVKMDVAMASTTQLLDIKRGVWSESLAETLQIPLNIFPELLSSTDILGRINPSMAEKIGLRNGIPIIIGGGDTTCMSLGAGMYTEGLICSSLGTTSNVFGCLNELRLDPEMRISFYRHVVPGKWVFIAGTSDSLALRWYRDNLGFFEVERGRKLGVNAYRIIDQEASKSKPGAKGLVFLPFLTGARSPLWNPNAQGVLFGLRYHHKREDVVRAFLEAVAYSIRHRTEVIKELGLELREVRAVGGGAKSQLWNKIIADVTGLPVSRLENEEAGVLGATMLSGIAIGIYKDFEEACMRVVKTVSTQFPDFGDKRIYDKAFKTYTLVYQSLLEPFEKSS